MMQIDDNTPRVFLGMWIPRELWFAEDLNFKERFLIAEVFLFSDKTYTCYASNKEFQEVMRVTPSRIGKMLSALQKKGYLTMSYDKGNSNRRIYLTEKTGYLSFGGVRWV